MTSKRSTRRTLTSLAKLILVLSLMSLSAGAFGQSPSSPQGEDAKIESLIETVANLQGAVFIRNGTEHSPREAADHMRTKWKATKSKIKTAGDFIRLAASVSSVSGKPYLIRWFDGRTTTSGEFLLKELARLEERESIPESPPSATTQAATRSSTEPHPSTLPSESNTHRSKPEDAFDFEGSDPQAVELADKVLIALGGQESWNATRFITWQFLGRRTNVWDKLTDNVRIELGDPGAEAHQLILMNLNTGKGRTWRGGTEVTDPDQLQALLQSGLRAWQNDSYWMFMPYKLKDPGVTLKYLGERMIHDALPVDVIQLTFKDSTDKYEVAIARDTKLVCQWSYFESADSQQPKFVQPWSNWKRYGRIALSDDRGPGRRHSAIMVFETLPESIFTSPEPVRMFAFREKALPVSDMPVSDSTPLPRE